MHSLDHEITIDAPADLVFTALSTAEGLRGWFTKRITGSGGVGDVWSLEFEGRPGFEWRVEASQPTRVVVWECLSGPGDSAGTTVLYRLQQLPDGRTRLHLSHQGWPHTSGNFTKCNTLWGGLLHNLKRYSESGEIDPTYP